MKLNKPLLKKLLTKIRGRKILVIGDVGVDRYVTGVVERISPEAPVPLLLVEDETLKLGLAANVADNVKVLGGIPILVGVVGEDRSAQDFFGLLKKASISGSNLIKDPSRRTTLKERVVTETQQLLRVDYETQREVSKKTTHTLLAKITSLLNTCDGVILEDYAKGLIDAELAAEIFKRAKAAGKWVAVDPNRKTPLEYYVGATVLTPNTKEAEKLAGFVIRDESSLKKAGEKILWSTQAQHVVITRGKEGMAIFSKGSKSVKKIPTYARQVYDVSGAGDTVIAVLALALSVGSSIEEAAMLGNVAAGIEVGKRGTATVTPQEILTELEAHH